MFSEVASYSKCFDCIVVFVMKHFLLVLLIASTAVFIRWMRMGVGGLFRLRVDQQIGLFQNEVNATTNLLRVDYG